MTTETQETIDSVKEYYGRVLGSKDDLKTSACCTSSCVPAWQKDILAEIDDEILEKFYGCGTPIPDELDGCTVLDLGSGTGRDAYLLSRLVGEQGRVIGVDMTDEQLEVARRHVVSQAERFGYARPNVEFHQGYIEDLAAVGIPDNSVDVVVSNCVINLSPDKPRVFREVFRVLKPGGELYFSDVYAGRRVPAELLRDPVLYGECLAGALYRGDFLRILGDCGCPDVRVVSESPITVEAGELGDRIGMIDFYSITYRAFKLAELEEGREDYGQVAVYRGTLPRAPHAFVLDDEHVFPAGKPELVCGNTAAMLGETRFARHFELTGDRSVHYGPFGQACAASGSCCC
jgi:SAM-dependent methyltransferase